MTDQSFLDGRVRLLPGDCLERIRDLPDNSIDACVTDPPYGLAFMGKRWDTGTVAFSVAFWAEVYRVLKPGGHVLAMGGTRTIHRLICAIEDAGFEIRDMVVWITGQGFPKSLNVSKAIDKAAGAERTATAPATAPATDAARQWDGWGTGLKPALEPVTLARKPLSEGTVAANVLAHGTGALNVGACRVGTTRGVPASLSISKSSTVLGLGISCGTERDLDPNIGRFPANVLLDDSPEVAAAFAAQSKITKSTGGQASLGAFRNGDIYGKGQDIREKRDPGFGDTGTAARFFYSAKASKTDRAGSKHPTIKPVSLKRYLTRLITPPGGTVLDPFAGTGTTGEAAYEEGFDAILIECEEEYQADIVRRMLALSRRSERYHASSNQELAL